MWFQTYVFLWIISQEIRKLQNEMDKAKIKYEAARNITKRYQEIMRYMEEVLQQLEKTLVGRLIFIFFIHQFTFYLFICLHIFVNEGMSSLPCTTGQFGVRRGPGPGGTRSVRSHEQKGCEQQGRSKGRSNKLIPLRQHLKVQYSMQVEFFFSLFSDKISRNSISC